MAYRIHEHEPVADAIHRITEDLVAAGAAQLGDESDSADRRVHEVRKLCKRMRALLRLVRPALKRSAYREENVRYRDLGRLASSARDAKVVLDCFDSLVEDSPESLSRTAGLRVQLVESLQTSTAAADPESALRAIGPELAAARRALGTWEFTCDGFAVIEDGYRETYRRGRVAFERAYDQPTPDHFHEWRKHAKYALYQTGVLRNLWEGPLRARIKATKRLGEDLGREHDLHMLRSMLVELPGAHDHKADLLFELEAEREHLRQRCRLAGRRLYVESPLAHGKRMRGLWKAWRARS